MPLEPVKKRPATIGDQVSPKVYCNEYSTAAACNHPVAGPRAVSCLILGLSAAVYT